MNQHFIQINNLHKSFENPPVLKGVNLEIKQGESIVIIGQSGCGKSVLLKNMIWLLQPDKGDIIFDNANLSTMSSKEINKLRRRFGMLFQSAALFDSLTVEENVGLGLRESWQYTSLEIKDLVNEKLALVGLNGANEKYPSELSGGMRKRVGLARAIAHNPEVILYDEPTTGLDPISADMIDDLIVDLYRKLKVTSVAVTHDMKSAFKIADRIVMLYQGKIEFDGSPDEIKVTDNEVVQQFITGSATGPIQV